MRWSKADGRERRRLSFREGNQVHPSSRAAGKKRKKITYHSRHKPRRSLTFWWKSRRFSCRRLQFTLTIRRSDGNREGRDEEINVYRCKPGKLISQMREKYIPAFINRLISPSTMEKKKKYIYIYMPHVVASYSCFPIWRLRRNRSRAFLFLICY